MTIEWNKVTWYSKLLAVILFVATFYIAFRLGSSWEAQKAESNQTIPAVTPNQPTSPVDNNLSQTYLNNSLGFSIHYPLGYTVDESYTYQELGPGKDISGVKFTIPASLSAETNLGSDSYISVEEIPGASECSASLFLESGGPTSTLKTVTDNNTTYSVATSDGAGAGNRYDETVYAIHGSNPCIAVRYFIHYGVFENYPPGTIKQFDEASIDSQFDQIRRTLVINH